MPVAMITGGASWFSRETARLLLADGWHVALSDINMEHLNEVASELGAPPQLTTAHLDVTNIDLVQSYVSKLAAQHGNIDALINIAGGTNHITSTRLPFHESNPEFWEKVIRPGLYGTMYCCHSVLPHMIKARRGGIVTIASGMALRGSPRMAVYSTVKHGLIGLTQALAQEAASYGVRVNTVAPGSAESRWQPDIHAKHDGRASPLGRRTSAQDVANAIHFLLSDKADHITGSCLDLSGGTLLH